jgi:uncharacterized 2Fe-2S/4Fe-4S cluster protein (DUF4445 family)
MSIRTPIAPLLLVGAMLFVSSCASTQPSCMSPQSHNLDSAMSVGLLPEVDPDKIVYVGNGSLMGAWMSELSNHIRKDVVEVVRKMTSFELSEIPSFKDQYVASLFLPHTDSSLFPEAAERRSSQ